jgi:hypothetical protein
MDYQLIRVIKSIEDSYTRYRILREDWGILRISEYRNKGIFRICVYTEYISTIRVYLGISRNMWEYLG